MRRRVASCCCGPSLACDSVNLQCFGSTIPPKYVRIDGARSIDSRDNTIRQDSQGNRCYCVGSPFVIFNRTEVVHLEGPRVFLEYPPGLPFYRGWAYQLTGTGTLTDTSVSYCTECTLPPPPFPCPGAEILQRVDYRATQTYSGYFHCSSCCVLSPNECFSGLGFFPTYQASLTMSSTYIREELRHVCCDPPNSEKFVDRGTVSSQRSLVFGGPPNQCAWNKLCQAADEDFVNRQYRQENCSAFGFPSTQTTFTGQIKAVFATQ